MKDFGSKFIRQLMEETLSTNLVNDSDFLLNFNHSQTNCNICFFTLEASENCNVLRWVVEGKLIFDFPLGWGFKKILFQDSSRDLTLSRMDDDDSRVLLCDLISQYSTEYSIIKLSYQKRKWLGISFSNTDLELFRNSLTCLDGKIAA